MVILSDGKQQIPIRATNLTRIYYKQEFDRDFDIDIQDIRNLQQDESITRILFYMIWAMAKAEAFFTKKQIPQFNQWIDEYIDFDLEKCVDILLDEIKQGLTIKRTYFNPTKIKDKNEGVDRQFLPEQVLVICLKVGISMKEMNELTTQEIIDIMHVYSGEAGEQARMATPKEAAAFFS